ncbi:hypothetical protein HRbin11_02322 [bacterium HR11]|nr:hypothetical protein HRbin11_02322 [bacterium HR11]
MQDTSRRLLFVDLLKGLGTLWMIHRHTLDAVWDRTSPVPAGYPSFLIGIAAPIFLAMAGFVYAWLLESAVRRGQVGRRLRRAALRCGQVIAAGYLLQMPYWSLRKVLTEAKAEEWSRLFQTNVLQSIGYSLLLLVLLSPLYERHRRLWRGLVLVGTVLPVATAPWVWAWTADAPWGYLLSGVRPKPGSLFPLVPYAGYLFFGALLADVFRVCHQRGRETLFLVGCIVMGAGLFVLRWLPLEWPPAVQDADPRVFGHKAALLLWGLVLCRWVERTVRGRLGQAVLKVWAFLGEEILVIYVFHLMLVYGSPLNAGLRQYGVSLPWSAAAGLGLLVTAVSGVIAWLWATARGFNRWIPRAVIGYGLLTLALRPW